VDPFAIVLLAGLVGVGLWMWLIGRHQPSGGMEQFGLRSAREIVETREALEAEDLEQMLAAHNARRRRRGEKDLTTADLEARVHEDLADQRRRRQELASERELDQLLEVTNARRRAKGLPERTPEEARREFGPGDPPARG
jgi:hypothetical protein